LPLKQLDVTDKAIHSADYVHANARKSHDSEYVLQAIGWHTHKVLANDQDLRFPLSQTDVTQKEGRSVADYFGFLA
jgi:hypothetical protein